MPSADPAADVAHFIGAVGAELEARGGEAGTRFGIPHGPGCEFHTPGGHRFAIYELTRPDAAARLVGRRDF